MSQETRFMCTERRGVVRGKWKRLYQQDFYWEIESSTNNTNQPTTKSNHREILSSYQLRHAKEPNWKPHYNGNVLDKGEASNFKKLLG